MKISPKLIVGGVVFALAVSCFNAQDRASDGASSTGSTAAAVPLARPTGNLPANYHAIYGVYFDTPDGRHEQGCHDDGGVYDGGLACHVGGETVVVTRAVDGDTVELTDGRRVRILGVDAPEVGTCGADAATAYTQAALVGNRLVVLHREPGVTKDQHGRELGHLQYVTSDTNKHWAQPASGDLGNALALEGLVDVYEGGDGNATYTEAIRSSVDIAKQVHGGNWGPPCGEPAPTYEPEPADDSDTDVYVDTDVDDDGGGESRFCRGRWWC